MNRRFLLLIAALSLAVSWYSSDVAAQVKVLPGSATRGEGLLIEKGCVNCHDLSRTPLHSTTPGMLATAIWNSAPAMSRQKPIELTSAQAADLFAYMYSALYFAPPGNAERGRNVFEKKNCANCHSEERSSTGPGHPLSTWPAVKDPIAWTGRMWNHSGDMSRASANKALELPKLSSQDVADLMMYLRSLPSVRSQSATFAVSEPELGRLVFERSCESCHSFGPGTRNKIDLLQRPSPQTVTGYIAAMWNHAELMRTKSGKELPEIAEEDMRHLAAFLFSQFYFFERGDTARGERVFRSKNCANCHEGRRAETGAPDLTQTAEMYSPITLTSAAWSHAAAMVQIMKRDGMEWPRFRGSEMADLIAYLNSRVVVRISLPARHPDFHFE